MKYKVGDRVRIKNLDWYNDNKDEYGDVKFLIKEMSEFCGEIMTIKHISGIYYIMEESDIAYGWTDEMIEGVVNISKLGTAANPVEPKSNANCLTRERVDELATKIDKELPSGNQNVWELPDGYQFVDEDGNVINARKIVLEKKKKEYPKTYEECAEIIAELTGSDCNPKGCMGYMSVQLTALQKLLICRDAYRKIAGEDMGLGEPWTPDWKDRNQKNYCIYNDSGDIQKGVFYFANTILAFPTAEMRDEFYENFKEEIEICKELLK